MSKKHLDNSLKEHIISLYNRNYKVHNIADIYEVSDKPVYNIINNYKKIIILIVKKVLVENKIIIYGC